MQRHHRLTGLTIFCIFLGSSLFAEASAGLRVDRLRTAGLRQPLGLDEPTPSLTWSLSSARRGDEQTAFQVHVASSLSHLRANAPDIWDSGQVPGAWPEAAYAGPLPQPGQRLFWRVRVWDKLGQASRWSVPVYWEAGLMGAPFAGKWVGGVAQGDDDRQAFARSLWIRPQGRAHSRPHMAAFRKRFELPPDVRVVHAALSLAADDAVAGWLNEGAHQAWVNGESHAWRSVYGVRAPALWDVTKALRAGENVVAIEALDGPSSAMIAHLRVELEDGRELEFGTDETWRAARPAEARFKQGWQQLGFDDSAWPTAGAVASFGQGPWAANDPHQQIDRVVPPVVLRRAFVLNKPIAKARLYATAAGVYVAEINGSRVGSDVLAPGWTDYGQRLAYQTYDVTPLLRRGANAIAATVADGWFAGRLGFWQLGASVYGYDKALLAQLVVDYADGSREVIATDSQWRHATGAVRASDLYVGEVWDGRKQLRDMSSPTFNDRTWPAAVTMQPRVGRLYGQNDPPIRRIRRIEPVSTKRVGDAAIVYDFKENIAGRTHVQLELRPGERVRIRHGETLDGQGRVVAPNARMINTIIGGTKGEINFEPEFTYHGFRYAEIVGEASTISRLRPQISAVVLHTDLEKIGSFASSHEGLNRLHESVLRSVLGNSMSVPTDCPNRDERLGWTADGQLAASVAAFHFDVKAFYSKWVQDMVDGQREDGAVNDVAPACRVCIYGSYGWGDALVLIPATLQKFYRAPALLRHAWPAMTAWTAFLEKRMKSGSQDGKGWGDWMAWGPKTDRDLVAVASYAHTLNTMAQLAPIAGANDTQHFEQRAARTRSEFARTFITDDGVLRSDTQAAYALGFGFGLVPDENKTQAAEHFANTILRAQLRPQVGFLAAPHLLGALSQIGRSDLAYALITQRNAPSWLYMLDRGSSTIWEKWDAMKEGSDEVEGSLNHAALGAAVQWLHSGVAGIQAAPTAEGDGFAHVVVKPHVGGGLTWARSNHQAPLGKLVVGWKQMGGPKGQLVMDVQFPPGTQAEIHIPGEDIERMREGAKPLVQAPGVEVLGRREGHVVVRVRSGHYSLRSPWPSEDRQLVRTALVDQ